jgi:hypothetical protein
MSAVKSSLQRLRELTPALNKAADDAAKIMLDAERVLTKELNLGVTAMAIVEQNEQSEDFTQWITLEYRRVDGKFRIAVVDTGTEEGAKEEVTPWAECPRDVKLNTIPFLPKLLENLTSSVEQNTSKVEAAVAAVREMLQPAAAAE